MRASRSMQAPPWRLRQSQSPGRHRQGVVFTFTRECTHDSAQGRRQWHAAADLRAGHQVYMCSWWFTAVSARPCRQPALMR